MGLQIAGLASGINWTQIISELIQADSGEINQVKASQQLAQERSNAVSGLQTEMATTENDVFGLEDPSIYGQVSGSSTNANSTWQINAENGAKPGSYTIAVQQLATATSLGGAGNISQGLAATSDVSGLTIATLPTATAVQPGVFTVNGAQVTVNSTDSLQDVFDAINTATGGNVTAGYDPSTDKITLTSASGNLSLGAANDTSNFLQAIKLGNTGAASSTSWGTLGTLKTASPLASAGLATALSGQDSSGNGAFTVNGVSISYNVNTDSLATVLNRINTSSAGVTASYDAADNKMLVSNNSTGDTAINFADTSGNLVAALGLSGSGATQTYGKNALFSINGGATQTSTSNTLTASQLGVTGLNVTVTTQDTQTINVATDSSGMMSAINQFITDFNKLQGDITSETKITSGNGTVSTSILSAEHEVGDWSSALENAVFSAGSQSGGSVTSLDAMGIDFNGITGQLQISDSAKLQQALSSNPSGVQSFFMTAKTGFGSMVNAVLAETQSEATAETTNLNNEVNDYNTQIDTLQNSLDAEQNKLETEFTAMEDAESKMQSETATLNGLSGSTTTSSTSSNSALGNISQTSSSSSSSTSSSSSSSG